MILNGNATAIAPKRSTSFGASGGTAPYVYTVQAGGAGGTIDPASGVYTAPVAMSTDPAKQVDVIIATDAGAVTAQAQILIGDPIFLLMEILWRELGIAQNRVWLYNQKTMQPSDGALFIVLGILNSKPFGNTSKFEADGTLTQSVNMMTTLSLNIMSRSLEALTRKEEVLMALASQYSEQQQESNSFYIAKLPAGSQFINLSELDGAAIPYRFNISINIQYFVTKNKAVDYFDSFAIPLVVTEP